MRMARKQGLSDEEVLQLLQGSDESYSDIESYGSEEEINGSGDSECENDTSDSSAASDDGLASDSWVNMLLVFAAIALAAVAAEAPVEREYLPPSQQDGAPIVGGSNALSTQYGAPAVIGGNPALDGRYAGPLGGRYAGPIVGRYAAPGSFPGGLTTQYGAPSAFDIGRPSAQYGVPFPGGRFGAPGSFYAPSAGYATGGDYDPLAEPANYEFSYDVNDPPSGNEFGHAERRQGEVAQGRYYVVLPDGRRQVVEYQADQDGYKPQVRYEDTGRGYAGAEGYRYAAGRPGGYTY